MKKTAEDVMREMGLPVVDKNMFEEIIKRTAENIEKQKSVISEPLFSVRRCKCCKKIETLSKKTDKGTRYKLLNEMNVCKVCLKELRVEYNAVGKDTYSGFKEFVENKIIANTLINGKE